MGGAGALTLALRNPARHRSVSALGSVCAPMRCPWAKKPSLATWAQIAEAWRSYDATELVQRRRPGTCSGTKASTSFVEQLRPELLSACRGRPVLELRRHAGYDHSYYFVSTFVPDHLRHHARARLDQLKRSAVRRAEQT
ncbi:MAG: alpha/beta hydrolase-fold protein [Polyangiaceae bacterium]